MVVVVLYFWKLVTSEQKWLIDCYFKNCDLKRKSPSPRPLVEEAEIKQRIESVQHCIYVGT